MKKYLEQIINQHIESNQKQVDEHEAIKEMLAPLEGKNIDRRTFNENRLGKFSFEIKHGMYHIVGEYRHLLGHAGADDQISVKRFEALDTPAGVGARKRLEQLRELDIEEAADVFNGIHQAYAKLVIRMEALKDKNLDSYHFPPFYEVLKHIENKTGRERPKQSPLSNVFMYKT